MEVIARIREIVNNPAIQDALWPWNWILGGIGIALLVFYLYLFFFTPWFKFVYGSSVQEFLSFRPFGLKPKVRQWRKIRELFEKGERGPALLEARTMLSALLERLGYGGTDLPSQIEQVPQGVLLHLEELGQAVRLAQSVKENAYYPVAEDAGEKALQAYEVALGELEVL